MDLPLLEERGPFYTSPSTSLEHENVINGVPFQDVYVVQQATLAQLLEMQLRIEVLMRGAWSILNIVGPIV